MHPSFACCMPCNSIHASFVGNAAPSSSTTSSSSVRKNALSKIHRHRRAAPSTGAKMASSSSTPPPSSSSLSLIIWDVDGTLANTTTLAFEATNEVLKKHELPEVSLQQYEHGSRYTTPKRFSYHACGDSEGEKELGEKLGACFDEYYVELVTTETAGLFAGVRSVIERTRKNGVRHAALSNACGEYARRVVAVNQLDTIFEMSLGADDVSKAKPEPDGIRELCKKVNVEVSKSVYVGDAPSDGKAAKAAGCLFSVGVNWGSHDLSDASNKSHFDIVCETREELERFFLTKALVS